MLTRWAFHSCVALTTACALMHFASRVSRASISNLSLTLTSAHMSPTLYGDTCIYAFISSTIAFACPRKSEENIANCRLKLPCDAF